MLEQLINDHIIIELIKLMPPIVKKNGVTYHFEWHRFDGNNEMGYISLDGQKLTWYVTGSAEIDPDYFTAFYKNLLIDIQK